MAAHLAALRAAAAVVAARAEPGSTGRRRKPQSVWELLPRVEPALCEWAAFFAAGAGKRAAAEAGLSRAVSAREADDLLRDAGTFVGLAESALGIPAQEVLPLRLRRLAAPAGGLGMLAQASGRSDPDTQSRRCQLAEGQADGPAAQAVIGQNESMAPRASASRMPQLISSSVRSAGVRS